MLNSIQFRPAHQSKQSNQPSFTGIKEDVIRTYKRTLNKGGISFPLFAIQDLGKDGYQVIVQEGTPDMGKMLYALKEKGTTLFLPLKGAGKTITAAFKDLFNSIKGKNCKYLKVQFL